MLVIVGLAVLLAAVIVGFTGVLIYAGPAHPLTENFAVFGDCGWRGGDGGAGRVAGRCAAHRGPRARRPTRTPAGPALVR